MKANYKESISKNNLLILTIKYGQAPVDVSKIDPKDYHYFKKVLVDRRNYKEAKDLPEEAINLFRFCKLGRLHSMSLWNFVDVYPKFAKLVDWSKMPSYHVTNLIIDRKELLPYANFDVLDNIDIVRLLIFRPEYADLVNLQKLSSDHWTQLLISRPELTSYCVWDKFSVEDWVYLISKIPEFVDKCPCTNQFTGSHISYILRWQTHLAERFNLWKINDEGWADLVRACPGLAGIRSQQSITGCFK